MSKTIYSQTVLEQLTFTNLKKCINSYHNIFSMYPPLLAMQILHLLMKFCRVDANIYGELFN